MAENSMTIVEVKEAKIKMESDILFAVLKFHISISVMIGKNSAKLSFPI